MNQELTFTVKCIVTAAGGWLWQAIYPAMPFQVVCTVMVAADFISARRLARRLGRKVPSKRQSLKFSSAKFGKSLAKVARIYGLLLLTAMVQYVVIPEVNLLRYIAAAVCFWQAVSILENEASANDAQWARVLGKILIDKTERHLGISLDELKSLIK